jgi:NarL family two-component system response regulator LiaR
MEPPTSNQETNSAIRVLITDDHAVVRKGLQALLMTESDIEVIGEAENGEEAVTKAHQLHPDVILMDIVMPKMDGIEAIRRISTHQPKIRILVLTSFATDEKVFPAIKAGALGYLLKDSEPAELVQAIHQVYRREPSLHPTIAKKVLQELPVSADLEAPSEPLTEQEIEILRLVARGGSNQEIGAEWVVDESVVQSHINSILNKLHLASRTQAVLYALQEGLTSLTDAAPGYVSRLLDALPDSGFEAPNELEALRQIATNYEQMGEELALAGKIQASFLPGALPQLTGWQLAATLEPAKEISGDFYDFISLPNGHLGILVADVVGKGMGAALYMALSRTIIRTYAIQYATQPALALSVANQRIQADTQAEMFVTIFYGVLNPTDGTLTYCSAGHNPPYLLNPQAMETAQALACTGPPLGIFEDMSWQQKQVQLAPSDVLVLYTDGVTEAHNPQAELFGSERLLAVVRANLNRSAQAIQAALLNAVHDFTEPASDIAQDDLTLMVMVREAA